MIDNIMKCQKSSIRYLYWLYLFSSGDHHFCTTLAPECTCTSIHSTGSFPSGLLLLKNLQNFFQPFSHTVHHEASINCTFFRILAYCVGGKVHGRVSSQNLINYLPECIGTLPPILDSCTIKGLQFLLAFLRISFLGH